MWFRPAGAGMVDGAAAGGFPAPPWSAGWPRVSRWAAMVTATGIRTTPVTAMAAITRPPMAIMADPITPVMAAATGPVRIGAIGAGKRSATSDRAGRVCGDPIGAGLPRAVGFQVGELDWSRAEKRPYAMLVRLPSKTQNKRLVRVTATMN